MISVIIPLYNAEKSIENTLDSVKNQTWRGTFEIIIVDDGSTDRSAEITQNFISKNPLLNIKFLRQLNGGVSHARNKALKIAKGEFIALLDADDEWYPEKTERQMKYLENEKLNIDFLGCRRKNHILKFPYKTREGQEFVHITFRKLMLRNETQPSTVIFKRNILQNTGLFDENQRFAEDLNYWLRSSAFNHMYLLNEELVLAGAGKRSFGVSGLSANLKEMERGFQKNLWDVYHSKRIGLGEYLFYFAFYKVKYIVRIGRNFYLKTRGK